MTGKAVNLFALCVMLFLPVMSSAETKNLNDVLAKATQEEMSDLPKLLKQIQLAPTENSLMRVIRVEKGSVYDREGIQVGDLILTGQTAQSGPRKMRLKQSLKSTVSEESFKK